MARKLHGVEHGTTEVDGVSVSYYDSGLGADGHPLLLLLHGSSGSAQTSFASLHPMLAMRRRVVAFDFVDPIDAGDAMSDHYLAQVDGVLAAIDATTAVDVAGYSFGAVIAAQFAARAPKAVRRLVLIAGWATTDAQQRLRNDLWFAVADRCHDALGEFAVLTAHSPRYLNALSAPELANLREQTAQAILNRATKMHFNRAVDIREALERIEAETLVIGCSEDQMAPVHHSHYLFGAIYNACYAEVSAGHAVLAERPAEVSTIMTRFLDDPEPIKPGTVVENTHA